MADFIAAIELGSSKIYGIVGQREGDGSIKLLAQAIEDSSGFIRKGVVLNLDKTANAIKSVVASLEKQLPEGDGIAKVYVGISGQSLHSKKNDVHRHLDEEIIISQKLVDQINDENRAAIMPADLEILDVEPQEFKIGINYEAEPVGIAGKDIEGHYLNIVARTALKKKLENSFELANIDIAEVLIAPVRTAKAVLTEAEMRSGCALVDFGADTTTVSIYKNNKLRFLSVIPLGGNNITHDIISLQMEEEEAEQLKMQYGTAIYEEEAGEGKETVIQLEDGSRTIELRKLNDIIEARIEEIVANVWNQIEYSGYQDKMLSGLIITGGGANLRNLDELLRRKTKMHKVRTAKFVRSDIKSDGTIVIEKDSTECTIMGLLVSGTENCRKEKKELPPKVEERVNVEPEPEQPQTRSSLFDDEELIDKEKLNEPKPPRSRKPKGNWITKTVNKISEGLFSDEEM
ncbi:cell division protein FtsA [Bacteroides sp. 519]|uniref:cell division protein FtsA n=1 Tax=Bacteroides sp. 519 TaxID=2302937 RepID=UPI0013CF6479|nr:cell division protein FtsA [Bacteroides sp. 519]NDV57326.1 cell division protein FtsA [Bacteroides sp. 519]